MRGFDRPSRRLLAAVAGIAVALTAVTTAAAAPAPPPADDPAPVVITSATNIDITLPIGRRIAGKVVNPANAGVGKVTLLACGAAGGACEYGESRADGAFSIGGLDPGTYLLSALHPDDSPLLGGYFGPNGYTANRTTATKINVTTQDSTNITLRLPSAPRSISGKVLGTATQAAGLPNVQVSACPNEAIGCVSATSRPDGTFTILGVPAGTYRLQVTTALGGEYVSPMWFGRTGRPSTDPGDIVSLISIGATDVTGLTLQMSKARAIRGSLVGTDGEGIEGAIAFACTRGACANGRTSADGSFTLFGAIPGDYSLRWIRPVGSTAASGVYGNLGFEPGWGTPKLIKVTATADSTVPQIKVPAGPFAISGLVRDAARKTLANAVVIACTSVLETFPLLQCETATTGADGRYAIAVLVPGSYTVRVLSRSDVNARGGFWAKSGWAATDAAAGRIDLGTLAFPGVKSTVPRTNATKVKTTSALKVTFTTDVRNANPTTINLLDALTNKVVSATVAYDAKTKTATLKPKARLKAKTPYLLQVSVAIASAGSLLAGDWRPITPVRVIFTTA